MGRIDEALRRAGTSAVRRSTLGEASADKFVSPWTSGDARPAGVAASPLTVVPSPSDGPRVEFFQAPVGRANLLDRMKPSWRERVVTSPSIDPGMAEQYRRLAAALLHAQRSDGIRSVMVTSAIPSDGKTLTSLNLALVLSGSFKKRVLLVEGDLRRPALSEAFGLNATEGLAAAIRKGDREVRKLPVIQMTDSLTLLPAGRPDSDPLSGLTSPRLQNILDEATALYDWVILDTPPFAAAADAGLLSPMVDGTLLVVRAGRTPYKALQSAVEAIGSDRIIGVVLNGVDDADASGFHSYYYYGTDAAGGGEQT